jgi:hypothetical protein
MKKNTKSILMSYMCPVSLKYKMEVYCNNTGVSKSEIIRRAIIQYINKNIEEQKNTTNNATK